MKGAKSKTDSRKSDNKLSVSKSGAVAKKGKAGKDPSKPKRPASAFFVFMEDFRTQYKEKHPNIKSVATVGKAGGAKWKSLTEEEKAPYVSKAEKRKNDYTKSMQAYNKKMTAGPKESEEEESDKSKSEVHDEDDSEEEEEDDE